MSNERDILEVVLAESVTLVRPLREATDSVSSFVMFMRELGWGTDAIPQAFQDLADGALTGLEVAVEAIQSDDADPSTVLALQNSIEEVVEAIHDLENAPVPASLTDDSFHTEFSVQLLQYLAVEYLLVARPTLGNALMLTGIIELTDEPAAGNRPAYLRRSFNFQRLEDLLTDPAGLFESLYGWGTDELDGNKLLVRVQSVLNALGVPAGLGIASRSTAEKLDGAAPSSVAPLRRRLDIPVYSKRKGGVRVRVAIAVIPLDKVSDPPVRLPGFAILPDLQGGLRLDIQLAPRVVLRLDGSLDVEGGIGLYLRPKLDPEVFIGFDDPAGLSAVSGEALVRLNYGGADQTPVFRQGPPEGSRIEIQSVGLSAGITAGTDHTLEVFFKAALSGGLIAFETDDADSFLGRLLPPEGLLSPFDLAVGFSNERGVYVDGSGGLELTVPVHLTLGPLELESIYIALFLTIGDAVELEGKVGITASAELGPLAATVQRVGLRVNARFPEDARGNLGPVDLRPAFLPPTGAGLAVDSSGINGGGFLDFDKDNERYAGLIQLNFDEIGLVGVGLITTKMPDGSKGYSMLINIGVTFSPPIQLSMGFTLSGVGGLIGIHRTMLVDVLQAGIRNQTLNAILFPENAVLNASKIISDLRGVFPPEQDSHVLSPMVKLGWGSPNVITADIGILIKLPDPVRYVIVGQVAASFPDEEDTVVELNIDILGIPEFPKKKISIDGTLYASRILEYPLSGDGALRYNWGDNPVFALALGGFHPRFSPPPAFPSLRRLTLNLSSTRKLQLDAKAYQALTANTLQFGARVELYAKQKGASVEGHLGFDTLFHFSPFSFEAVTGGRVVAKYRGHKLGGVKIKLTLSGPTPWNAKGKATFEILAWDVTVRFNKTWGRSDGATLPAVDPWDPHLKSALERPESWGATLPPARTMVEALRSLENGAQPGSEIVAHPAGTLEVRQKVLPLGVRLERFGNAPVKDHHTFRIEHLEADGRELALDPVDEHFARGQYEDLSDNQRLSLPSFEKMQGGVAAHSDDLAMPGTPEAARLEYESVLIDENGVARGPKKGDVAWDTAAHLMSHSAARLGKLRTTGLRRFQALGGTPRVAVDEEGYQVVYTSDLSAVDPTGDRNGTTRMAADQALALHVEQYPEDADQVQVVSSFEAAGTEA